MSEYDEILSVAKGGLKFKRSSKSSKKDTPKKKKSSKSAADAVVKTFASDLAASSPSSSKKSAADSGKTEAELKFQEISRKRQQERIMKLASKSHKQNVEEFNEKLGRLSEHYDIPKVGPG